MIKHILCALCLTVFSMTAQAGVYIGGGLGFSSFNYEDVDDGSSSKYYIGYQFNDNFSVQYELVDFGEADIDSFSVAGLSINDAKLIVDGSNLALVYKAMAGQQGFWTAKGGLYTLDTELEAFNASILKDDSSGVSLGAGGGLQFNDHVSLTADVEIYFDVEDFADDESVTLFNLGLQVNF